MEFRVSDPIQVANIPDIWSRVKQAAHRLLALDYDGTLAPFHADPMQAEPLPGIPALLKALNETWNTTIAVLSGRPASEVSVLLGDIGIPLVGCHGFESIDARGNLTIKHPSQQQLEEMERGADIAIRSGLREKLEIKTASIALHTRGMPRQEALEIEEKIFREWSRIATADLGCRRFNGGVELYCTGWNKGDALMDLLGHVPVGTLSVYIGDDATDEDAFRILRESGIGIKVGPPGTATAAKGFLSDCAAVRKFLYTWHSLTANQQRRTDNNSAECACAVMRRQGSGVEPSGFIPDGGGG